MSGKVLCRNGRLKLYRLSVKTSIRGRNLIKVLIFSIKSNNFASIGVVLLYDSADMWYVEKCAGWIETNRPFLLYDRYRGREPLRPLQKSGEFCHRAKIWYVFCSL